MHVQIKHSLEYLHDSIPTSSYYNDHRFQEMLESFDQQDVASEVLLASLEHYTIKTSFSADYLSQKYTNKSVPLLCRWVQGVAR